MVRVRHTSFPAVPLLFAALAVGAALRAPQAEEAAPSRHLRGNVHLVEGPGGTVLVSSGEDGLLIVDTKFAQTAPAIEAAARALGEGPLKFVVNTHWHGDHTGGNAHFGPSGMLVSHANTRARLAGAPGVVGRTSDDTPAEALPVVTFGESASLWMNGEEVRLVHLGAGHTDGDAIVWFTGSNVIHLGDVYFAESFPFVDMDSGGDVMGLIAIVEGVLEFAPEDALFVAGHGAPTGRDELLEYVAMLRETAERVRVAVGAGQDVGRMMEDGLLDEFDERWGQGTFITPAAWLTTLKQYWER